MLNKIRKYFKINKYEKRIKDIDPDEIFIDSENLPKFDTDQFEGRLEKPISINTFFFFTLFCIFIFSAFLARSYNLQVTNGETYLNKSENNRLKNTLVISNRGVIYDRNDNRLAWNISGENNEDFSLRKYSSLSGLSHVVGYLKYPSKDSSG